MSHAALSDRLARARKRRALIELLRDYCRLEAGYLNGRSNLWWLVSSIEAAAGTLFAVAGLDQAVCWSEAASTLQDLWVRASLEEQLLEAEVRRSAAPLPAHDPVS